jgi:CRISPR/Cas system-associated exonuclease Cas4 (RecB family)
MTTYSQVDINHERSLTSQLRAYAADKALNGPQRASRSIHGSSYYGCSRKTLYGLLGYEPTDTRYVWEWDLAARAGDAIHGLVQQEFQDSGKAVILANGKPAIELTLGTDTLPEEVAKEFASYKLGCRIDAVLTGAEGQHILIEIKTVDGKYLSGISQKYFPEKLADYEAQLQMSLNFYRNFKTGERSRYGVIYVVNRADVSERREYLVEYDQRFIEPELERIANIRDHWLQAKLTDPEPVRGKCGFCAWKSLCPLPESQKK